MADLSCTYVLTTPGPDITFNSGELGDGADKYWLQDVQGLDAANVSSPVDKVPMGAGSLVHAGHKRGRTPYLEGVLLVESVPRSTSLCQQILNSMEDNLRQAYDSIIAPASGTLAWTPAGLGARSLTVYRVGEQTLEIRAVENFALRAFTIPLMAAAAEWS